MYHFVSLILMFLPIQDMPLVPLEVAENIVMLIPNDFRPMTDDEIASKYITTKRPLALFTNPDQTIDLGVNLAVTRWNESDLKIMASFQKSNIYALYDEVKMLDEGIKEINGKQFAYFEFVSTVKQEEDAFIKKGAIQKYTYIEYLLIGNNSLVFNFSCPSRFQNQWQGSAKKIMESVEIRGKVK